MLLAVRQGDYLVLETQEALAEGDVKVVAEHVHVVLILVGALLSGLFVLNLPIHIQLMGWGNLHLPLLLIFN
jgi:hypothetical protein